MQASNSHYILNRESDIVAECFSAHYTNIFLIYLYNEARKYAGTNSNIPSITEGYKTAIASYNNAMSRDDFVKQTLNGIYNQFLKIDKTMRIRECTTKILLAFYPEDGYKGIIKQEKFIELAISKIIHDVTKLIIFTVPVNHAPNVIDRNDDSNTQKLMQDEFKEIVLELMTRNHIDYMNKKKSQYHNPGTDHVMFEKAKQELARANAEKAELEAKYNVLQKQLVDLQSINNDLREKAGNQQSLVRELEQQVSRLQDQLRSANTHQPYVPLYHTPVIPSVSIPHGQQFITQVAPAPVAAPVPVSTQKPRRDYSHILNNDSDSEKEETPVKEEQPTKKDIFNRLTSDEDDEINLDMYSK